MSSHIDKYRKRLKRNGADTGEAYANNTIAFIESTFHASPSFRVVKVKSNERPDIIKIDTRIVEVERMGSLREVLFRPKQSLPIGSYIEFDGNFWIVSDLWGDKEFTSRALVQRCNHELKWYTSQGWKDEDGEVNDNLISFPCLSSQSPIGSKATQGKLDIGFNRYDVMLASGQLFVYVERNEYTSEIKLNQRFIFGNNVYEVYGIDDASLTSNGYGIIQFAMKLTTVKDEDDFKNHVAYNRDNKMLDNSDETTPSVVIVEEEEEDEDEGGRIW